MAKPTCSDPACEKPTLARGMCVTHYHRWSRETKDDREPPGICRGCGATIPRTGKTHPAHYCGPDCRPRCSVDGCEKPRHGLTYCSAHHTRAARHGDPLAPLLRSRNVGMCAVEGCSKVSRKRGWCVGHYTRWQNMGDAGTSLLRERMPNGTIKAPKIVKASSPRSRVVVDDCMVCGAPNRVGDYRNGRFCSGKCSALFHFHKGNVPDSINCVRCGVAVDLATAGKNGRRKKSNTKLCKRCKAHHRTESTPGELALRDGPYCQLCGCDVDLSATFPDVMRPSVDHIIPRAWGGGDEAANNQLTHLRCNQIKSDRFLGRSWRSTA